MNRLTLTGNSVALDPDGLANDVGAATPGTTLFVLAATVPGDSLAHKIIITPSGSVTGDYVLTGTGPEGQAQTETLATDTVNAVTSAKYWLSLTSVKSPAGLGAATVDIGWTAASVTPWEFLWADFGPAGMGIACVVDSGSPTYALQYTLDGGVTAFTHADVTGETTSQAGTILTPVQAVRLIWAAAGEVTAHGLY